MPILPDKLPTESVKAYAAFVAYCELGTGRSLDKTHHALAKSSPGYTRVLKQWSAQHSWQKRVAEYDRAIALERADDLRQHRRAEVERLRQQNTDDATALRTLARGLLGKLAKKIAVLSEDDIDTKEIAPLLRTLSTTLTTATNLDASALGITDLLQHFDHGNVDTDSQETP